jgi:hypothetical protein
MYVKVDVTGDSQTILVVPSRALHGNTLYVVADDNSLHIRKVEIAYEQGGFSAIKSGVKVNESIVLSDILAPTEGMKIRRAVSNNKQSDVRTGAQP